MLAIPNQSNIAKYQQKDEEEEEFYRFAHCLVCIIVAASAILLPLQFLSSYLLYCVSKDSHTNPIQT